MTGNQQQSMLEAPHFCPKARMDNGCRSWQLNDGCVDNLSHERCCQWTPVTDTVGITTTPPSEEDYTKFMIGVALAAPMMFGVPNLARVQKNVDSDDR